MKRIKILLTILTALILVVAGIFLNSYFSYQNHQNKNQKITSENQSRESKTNSLNELLNWPEEYIGTRIVYPITDQDFKTSLQDDELTILYSRDSRMYDTDQLRIDSDNCDTYTLESEKIDSRNDLRKFTINNSYLCEGINYFVITLSSSTSSYPDFYLSMNKEFKGFKNQKQQDELQAANKLLEPYPISSFKITDNPEMTNEINTSDNCTNMGFEPSPWGGDIDPDKHTQESFELTDYILADNVDNLFFKITAERSIADDNEYYQGKIRFYRVNSDGQHQLIERIPEVNITPCHDNLRITYYNENLILVQQPPTHESYPLYLYFNGQEWANMEQIIKDNLNLDQTYYPTPFIVTPNQDYIAIQEQKYCCDYIPFIHPEKRTTFIIDPNSLKIESVQFTNKD